MFVRLLEKSIYVLLPLLFFCFGYLTFAHLSLKKKEEQIQQLTSEIIITRQNVKKLEESLMSQNESIRKTTEFYNERYKKYLDWAQLETKEKYGQKAYNIFNVKDPAEKLRLIKEFNVKGS